MAAVDLSTDRPSRSRVNAPSSPEPASPTPPASAARLGYLLGVTAYAVWGVLPVYFKLLKAVDPVSIVANRVCWSLLLVLLIVTAARSWRAVRTAVQNRRTLLLLTGSSTAIAVNWLLYVYAVNNGQILAGSLGYYLNPIASILLGRFLLKERLGGLQWIAVAIACIGIAVLAAGALGQLWISLILCLSFATYGFLRKIVEADALTGLAIETGILCPLALGWLIWAHQPGLPLLGPTANLAVLLAFSGVLTSVPLLLFTGAARRLPYSTVGVLQFIGPTLQFLVAVFLYGEPFTQSHAIAFAAIWTALALYVVAMVRGARQERLQQEQAGAMMR